MCVCVFSWQKALQEYAIKYHRLMELHSLPDQVHIMDKNAFFNDTRLGKKERKRLNITTTLKKSLSFSLPGAKLSVDFFKDQVGQTVFLCECVFCMVCLMLHRRHCVTPNVKVMNILITALSNITSIALQYFKIKEACNTASVTSVVVFALCLCRTTFLTNITL